MHMLDELPMLKTISPPNEVRNQILEPFDYNGLKFIPQPKFNGNQFKWCKYVHNDNNLRLVLSGDKLAIYNSLHKYYIGNNHSDYKFSDFINTIHQIEDKVSFKLMDSKILKASISCTIDYDSSKDLPTWLTLRRKSPQPMSQNGNYYGSKFQFADYYFKGYDKTKEVRMNNKLKIKKDLYRLELVGRRRMFNQQKIGFYTLKDLCNRAIWHDMTDLLVNKYESITKFPMINFDDLKLSELGIIGAMTNGAIRTYLIKQRPRTYKNYLRRLKAIGTTKNSEEVASLIRVKMEYLINH